MIDNNTHPYDFGLGPVTRCREAQRREPTLTVREISVCAERRGGSQAAVAYRADIHLLARSLEERHRLTQSEARGKVYITFAAAAQLMSQSVTIRASLQLQSPRIALVWSLFQSSSHTTHSELGNRKGCSAAKSTTHRPPVPAINVKD